MSKPVNVPNGWVPIQNQDGSVTFHPPDYPITSPKPYKDDNSGKVTASMQFNPKGTKGAKLPKSSLHKDDADIPVRDDDKHNSFKNVTQKIDAVGVDKVDAPLTLDTVEVSNVMPNLLDLENRDKIIAIRKSLDYIGKPKSDIEDLLDRIPRGNWNTAKYQIVLTDDEWAALTERSGTYSFPDSEFDDFRIIVKPSVDGDSADLTVYRSEDYIVYFKLFATDINGQKVLMNNNTAS